MTNKADSTKEKILQTALDLFSKRGYSAVSIRDIGGIVGIKESTLYYYFTNKQDLFDTLMQDIMSQTDVIKSRFNERFDQIVKLEKQDFVMVGFSILFGFLLDQRVLKFIRMLMIEQHVSEKAADIYQYLLVDLPLQQSTDVLRKMMELGYIKQGDAASLATEYYGIIYFIFVKYFSSREVTAERKTDAEKEIAAHLNRFYDMYSL